ncbi:MAG: hypothetical protein K0U66_06895, partial [Gammaproteobacteria bacterium]|nr:hypothetical protein [Gammaproteobacteria bacterium]
MKNPAHHLSLTLFGNPQVCLDNQALTSFNTRKDCALLFYLSVTGTPYSREHLAGLLWSDLPEQKARGYLRNSLSNLRKVIGPAWLETHQGIAMTQRRPWSVDVHKLQETLSALAKTPDRSMLQQALHLYQGEFLQGFHVRKAALFEEWLLQQREELRLLTLQGLEMLVQRCLEADDYATGLAATRRLLSLEPWSETTHCLQMKLLAYSGQRTAALAQYESCRKILADELDVEPMPETIALYAQIRAGDYGVEAPATLPTAPRILANPEGKQVDNQIDDERPTISHNLPAPLPKLIGYAEPADLPAISTPSAVRHNLPSPPTAFFGRDQEIVDLSQLLNQNSCRLVTLVGEGGVGKTRMALVVAKTMYQQPQFPNGVWLIALSEITTTPDLAHDLTHDLTDKLAVAVVKAI